MKRAEFKRGVQLIYVLSFVLGFTLSWGVPVLEGKTISFPEMSGWRQDGKAQVFSPKTLYEYINGAADLYLAYEFQDLQVAEYKGEKKAGVTVEVYRHKDPTQAFGIYSQERLANAKFLDLGAQGYHEPNVLNFLTGPYYVKINGFNTGEDDEKVLMPFAKKVAEILGEKTSLPPILSSFPGEGKKKNILDVHGFSAVSASVSSLRNRHSAIRKGTIPSHVHARSRQAFSRVRGHPFSCSNHRALI